MSCWTSDDPDTANGAGFPVQILSDSVTTGTSDSVQHVWRQAVAMASEDWTWTVGGSLIHTFVNCSFDGTNADGDDTVAARWRTISP